MHREASRSSIGAQRPNFADAARDAGVRHIVYLSGLGSGQGLSPHLTSRHEVGQILRDSGVATTELRASIVIGAGSASFEAVRAVVEQLPAIPAPDGLAAAAQPIAIDDLIAYLLAALTLPPRSVIFEIGGADQVSYLEVMREYASQRNLRRRVVPLPGRTLRASRALLGVLTPAYGRVAAAMVESLHDETIVRDTAAREVFAVQPRGLSEAIERALAGEDDRFADTSWGMRSRPLLPTMGWDARQPPARQLTGRTRGRPATGCVRLDPSYRRCPRVVRRRLVLASAWPARRARRWPGAEARAPRSTRPARGRCGRLLARPARRNGSPPAACRRDEAARALVAPVRCGRGRSPYRDTSDDRVRSGGDTSDSRTGTCSTPCTERFSGRCCAGSSRRLAKHPSPTLRRRSGRIGPSAASGIADPGHPLSLKWSAQVGPSSARSRQP